MAGEQHVQKNVRLEAEEAPDSEIMLALCVQQEVWGCSECNSLNPTGIKHAF